MENGFRWLTVGPKGQKDFEIILMPVGMSAKESDPQAAELLRSVIAKGILGAGVFETADCRQTYEELKAKGVEFTRGPTTVRPGVRVAFLRAPEGVSIELLERKPV